MWEVKSNVNTASTAQGKEPSKKKALKTILFDENVNLDKRKTIRFLVEWDLDVELSWVYEDVYEDELEMDVPLMKAYLIETRIWR